MHCGLQRWNGSKSGGAPFDSGVPAPFVPGRIDLGESKDEQATKQGRGGNMAGKTKDELLHDHSKDGIDRRGFLKCMA